MSASVPRNPAGFTLLEVVVAMTVMGLILMLLTQANGIGSHALARFQRRGPIPTDIVFVEHALRNIIEHMDVGRFPDPPRLHAGSHELTFATQLPSLSAVGVTPAEIRLEASNGRLILWWTPTGNGQPFIASTVAQPVILLPRVRALNISYAARDKPGIWQGDWTGPTIPGIIKLEILPLTGQPDWPAITVRTISEPAEE